MEGSRSCATSLPCLFCSGSRSPPPASWKCRARNATAPSGIRAAEATPITMAARAGDPHRRGPLRHRLPSSAWVSASGHARGPIAARVWKRCPSRRPGTAKRFELYPIVIANAAISRPIPGTASPKTDRPLPRQSPSAIILNRRRQVPLASARGLAGPKSIRPRPSRSAGAYRAAGSPSRARRAGQTRALPQPARQ